ncbi:MAG: radical SAM protein [Fusobacteriaceae bacterium]
MYKYIFGPVPSRRLGVSLGIDLVVQKTCNYNCVYCECGRTTKFSTERKSYVDIPHLKSEIEHAMEKFSPDFITFSGAGEPTLNSDLGEVAKWIKNNFKNKIALITNGSLLYLDEVLEQVLNFDVIIPSLNAVDENIFMKINRAPSSLNVEQVKIGLQKLSEKFAGEIYIELFIIEGINDESKITEDYAKFLKTIKYTKLQLNSLARNGAESWVKAPTREKLFAIKKDFENFGIKNVEVIEELKEIENKIEMDEELIKNMEEKRKYNEEELAKIFKINHEKN